MQIVNYMLPGRARGRIGPLGMHPNQPVFIQIGHRQLDVPFILALQWEHPEAFSHQGGASAEAENAPHLVVCRSLGPEDRSQRVRL